MLRRVTKGKVPPAVGQLGPGVTRRWEGSTMTWELLMEILTLWVSDYKVCGDKG